MAESEAAARIRKLTERMLKSKAPQNQKRAPEAKDEKDDKEQEENNHKRRRTDVPILSSSHPSSNVSLSSSAPFPPPVLLDAVSPALAFQLAPLPLPSLVSLVSATSLSPASIAPMPIAPVAVAPMPVAPMPVVPMPVVPMPVAPMPLAPIVAPSTTEVSDSVRGFHILSDDHGHGSFVTAHTSHVSSLGGFSPASSTSWGLDDHQRLFPDDEREKEEAKEKERLQKVVAREEEKKLEEARQQKEMEDEKQAERIRKESEEIEVRRQAEEAERVRKESEEIEVRRQAEEAERIRMENERKEEDAARVREEKRRQEEEREAAEKVKKEKEREEQKRRQAQEAERLRKEKEKEEEKRRQEQEEAAARIMKEKEVEEERQRQAREAKRVKAMEQKQQEEERQRKAKEAKEEEDRQEQERQERVKKEEQQEAERMRKAKEEEADKAAREKARMAELEKKKKLALDEAKRIDKNRKAERDQEAERLENERRKRNEDLIDAERRHTREIEARHAAEARYEKEKKKEKKEESAHPPKRSPSSSPRSYFAKTIPVAISEALDQHFPGRKAIQVPGDGDCVLHALQYWLDYESPRALRDSLVSGMHGEHQEALRKILGASQGEWKELLHKASNDRRWLSDQHLRIVSFFAECGIWTVSHVAEKAPPEVRYFFPGISKLYSKTYSVENGYPAAIKDEDIVLIHMDHHYTPYVHPTTKSITGLKLLHDKPKSAVVKSKSVGVRKTHFAPVPVHPLPNALLSPYEMWLRQYNDDKPADFAKDSFGICADSDGDRARWVINNKLGATVYARAGPPAALEPTTIHPLPLSRVFLQDGILYHWVGSNDFEKPDGGGLWTDVVHLLLLEDPDDTMKLIMNQRVLPRFLAQGHPGEYDGESGAAGDIRWNPKVLDEWKKTDGKTNHRETAIRAFSNMQTEYKVNKNYVESVGYPNDKEVRRGIIATISRRKMNHPQPSKERIFTLWLPAEMFAHLKPVSTPSNDEEEADDVSFSTPTCAMVAWMNGSEQSQLVVKTKYHAQLSALAQAWSEGPVGVLILVHQNTKKTKETKEAGSCWCYGLAAVSGLIVTESASTQAIESAKIHLTMKCTMNMNINIDTTLPSEKWLTETTTFPDFHWLTDTHYHELYRPQGTIATAFCLAIVSVEAPLLLEKYGCAAGDPFFLGNLTRGVARALDKAINKDSQTPLPPDFFADSLVSRACKGDPNLPLRIQQTSCDLLAETTRQYECFALSGGGQRRYDEINKRLRNERTYWPTAPPPLPPAPTSSSSSRGPALSDTKRSPPPTASTTPRPKEKSPDRSRRRTRTPERDNRPPYRQRSRSRDNRRPYRQRSRSRSRDNNRRRSRSPPFRRRADSRDRNRNRHRDRSRSRSQEQRPRRPPSFSPHSRKRDPSPAAAATKASLPQLPPRGYAKSAGGRYAAGSRRW